MKISKVSSVRRTMEAPSTPAPKAGPAPKKSLLDGTGPVEKLGQKSFKRIPFGTAQLYLSSTSIPDHHLHWINDWHNTMPNRLQQALTAGYTFVHEGEVETGSRMGNSTADLSTRVSRIVGTRPDGQPITAYLMKIPEAWHLEHQAPVWERADQVDAAIRRGVAKDLRPEERYVPKGQRISLNTKFNPISPLTGGEGDSDG